jgi:hypothetical protein
VSFKVLTAALGEVDVIAVDIPIGIGHTDPRLADVAARKFGFAASPCSKSRRCQRLPSDTCRLLSPF